MGVRAQNSSFSHEPGEYDCAGLQLWGWTRPHLPLSLLSAYYVCSRCLYIIYAAAAKSPQSCPTLCDPMDSSPPGSSVHGIIQARTLKWVAYPFSSGYPRSRNQTGSPALQVDSLPTELSGKPKCNTGHLLIHTMTPPRVT